MSDLQRYSNESGESAELELFLVVDKSSAVLGEQLVNYLAIVNKGNIQADSIMLVNFPPKGTVLVPNSIYVDALPYEGEFPVTLGPLDSNDMTFIKFTITVNSYPYVNPISDIVRTKYTFTPSSGESVSITTESNPYEIYIIHGQASVQKYVDKAIAQSGEELLYTSIVTNISTLAITDIVFKDTVDSTFIEDSVEIDGVSMPKYNPSQGFPLPDLLPGQSTTVTFRTTIKKEKYL